MKPLLAALLLLCPLARLVADEPDTTPQLRIETGMHTAAVNRIGVDASGTLVLTCADDKTARLWQLSMTNAAGGSPAQLPAAKLLRTLRPPLGPGNEGKLRACALSPDGTLAAVGGYTGFEWDKQACIYLFDTASGRMVRRFPGLPEIVTDLAFSPNGSRLAASFSMTRGFKVLDVASGQILAQDSDYQEPIAGMDWHGENRLATSSNDECLRLYQVEVDVARDRAGGEAAGLPVALVPVAKVRTTLGKPPSRIRFSPDGRTIAVGFRELTHVSLHDGQNLQFLSAPDVSGVPAGGMACVAWSYDGLTLAAGSTYDEGRHFVIRLWSNSGHGRHRDVDTSVNTLMDLRPLPDGRILFAAADPAWGTVDVASLFQSSGGRTPGAAAHRCEDSPRADYRGMLGQFRASSDASVLAFDYLPWGRSPAIFSVGERRLDKLLDGENLPANLRAARSTGLDVTSWENAYAPRVNARALPLRQHEKSRTIAIASDAAFFLLGSDLYVHCFNRDGRPRWHRPMAIPGLCRAVNLSGDDRLAVVACSDGTIRWHDVAHEGKELLAFFPHADQKRWVLWTPQGYYDCSPGGEDLIGWHVNRGKDHAADFYPAAKFRDTYYRPDVVSLVLETLDGAEALKQADAARGRVSKPAPDITVVTQTEIPPVVELRVGGVLGQVELAADATGLPVRYRVRGGSGRVDKVYVKIDGRPLELKAPVPAGDNDDAEVLVPVPDKDCVVAVLASNRFSISEPAMLRVQRAAAPQPVAAALLAEPMRGTLRILAVGVSRLENQAKLKNFAALEYADADARLFAETMQRQQGRLYKSVEPTVLVNEMATAAKVRRALEDINNDSKNEDTTMFLLAGHGVTDTNGRFMFCAHDYDPRHQLDTGVGFEVIKLVLATVKGDAYFFLDACSAGNVMGGSSKVDVSGLLNRLSDDRDGNVVVFAASDGRSPSMESDDLKQGLFTYALAQGLNGKADILGNGKITTTSLQTWLDAEIPRLSSNHQRPVFATPHMVPNRVLSVKVGSR